MTIRKNWLDFANIVDVTAEYHAGPQDLAEIAPGQWGIRGVGIVCLGDQAHMRKVQAKRFKDRFNAAPCNMGYYGKDQGGPPLPTVLERISA